MKTHYFAILSLFFTITALNAQTPPSIPGVPEPGMTIWGAVTAAVNGAPVAITSANWSLADNATPVPTSFTLTSAVPSGGTSKPHIRIITQGAQTYYVMQVPFDTRTVGNGTGTVTLTDPKQQTDPALRYDSFPIKVTAPIYTMTPTMNGLLANVKSVDGANAVGSPANFTTPSTLNPGFTFSERARVVRVDLTVSQTLAPYDTWAAGYFSGYPTADGAQTADADADGQNNYAEYQAGTNPLDSNSRLRILALTRAASGTSVTLNWASEAGRKYQIETSLTGQNGPNPWTPLGAQTTGAGITSVTVPPLIASPAEPRRLYRVKIVP
jgi:hypothetical protein